MRRFRSSLSLLLCIALFASLFSGFTASAAPIKQQQIPCREKVANLTIDSAPRQQDVSCCLLDVKKIDSASAKSLSPSPSVIDVCCDLVSKLPVRGKTQIGVNQEDPCAPPVVDTSCGISYPAGSVVGEIPFDQPAFYAPGLAAPGVTINAGTYWVTGLGEAANGDKFYQIVVACQFLFVRANDVVPSYQAPWSGQPLPTTPPVES